MDRTHRTASGASTSEPGISISEAAPWRYQTLGGYWRVHMPNGRTAILRQTDIGPARWTGRMLDFTYTALQQLGYTEGSFPTDAVASAEYIGRTPNG